MRTVTISIDDSIYEKFMGFLELLPKGKIKVTRDDKQKKLEELQENIKKSFEDIKLGRVSKTGKVVRLES